MFRIHVLFPFGYFLIPDLIFNMLVIMSAVSMFGKLVYMFSMSNEHILVAFLISMVFRSVISCVELCMLYVCSR
jgi:hypothetical protein